MDGTIEHKGDRYDRTILLVDDDEAVRQVTGVLLGGLGYRILEAAQAAEALALLERAGGVDLLLTDIGMPGGMSGIELAETARRRHPGLRVLFTTGSTEAGAAPPAIGSVLQKPYRFETLMARLEAALA